MFHIHGTFINELVWFWDLNVINIMSEYVSDMKVVLCRLHVCISIIAVEATNKLFGQFL